MGKKSLLDREKNAFKVLGMKDDVTLERWFSMSFNDKYEFLSPKERSNLELSFGQKSSGISLKLVEIHRLKVFLGQLPIDFSP